MKSELEAERVLNKTAARHLNAAQTEEQKATQLVTELTNQLKEQKEVLEVEMKRQVAVAEEEAVVLRMALRNLSERLENPQVTVHPAENALLKRLNKPMIQTSYRGDNDTTSPSPSSSSSSFTTSVTSDDVSVSVSVDKSSPMKTASASTVATFERNLVTLRNKLRTGIKCHLWEEGHSSHVHSFECLLTLDRSYEALIFTAAGNRRGTFSIFSQKVEVEPIRIKDIDDISQGSEPMVDLSLLSVLGLGLGQGQIGRASCRERVLMSV